jgi:hypothetical protein
MQKLLAETYKKNKHAQMEPVGIFIVIRDSPYVFEMVVYVHEIFYSSIFPF